MTTPEAATTAGRSDLWPKEPYKGLAFYGIEDRLLFSGRDRDVDVCIQRLASAETRILLLHGNTGCGKSSFLRAGLIPGLEERGFGYFFLRDAEGSPLFIRCGPDPLGRIAEHVFRFASASVPIEGVASVKTLDLSAARLGYSEPSEFVTACRQPGMLMKSLHEISAKLPFTLVIILDQAEEVITLGDATPEYRRQFFRFIREFSRINFPIKLVLALRKDHSGRFIELAQEGGAIDLSQGVPSADTPKAVVAEAPPGLTNRVVKADVKLFLLSEFGGEEVEHAIKLPTSKEPLDDLDAPFAHYGFEYEPGVAEEIVKDLFDTRFTAAVLPVMQIVCRDLYQHVVPMPATAAGKPATRVITMAQYKEGGRISGPVDRHISASLRASFGAMQRSVDLEAEERRWREILYRLVRRESDGTVHTRIVTFKELREIAADEGSVASVDTVVAYLTQPEILLLRGVTVLSGAATDDTMRLSLGHDFIAMVLQRWKVAEEATEFARERIAKIRRRAFITGLSVASIIALVGLFTVVATNAGKTIQTHEVLLNTVKASQREAPMLAMLASAHAMSVSDDMKRYLFWKAKDVNAEYLLAELLAGLPETKFAAAGSATRTSQADFTTRIFGLPKSGGFVDVDGNYVRIAAAAGNRPVELRTLNGSALGASLYRPTTSVSESKSGAVLLLSTSSASPVQELSSSQYQVYVLLQAKNEFFGPFGADYFLQKLGADTQADAQAPEKSGRRKLTQVFRQLSLSGGAVVLSTSTLSPDPGKSTFRIDTFAFADTAPPADPFVHNFKLESAAIDAREAGRGGLPQALLFDDFLVVPEAATGTSSQRLVKYDLSTPSPGREDLIPAAAQERCPRGCEWRWIPGADSANRLLVFGAPRTGTGIPQRSFDQASISADLNAFGALWIIDVARGRGTVLDTRKVSRAVAACAVGLPAGAQEAQRTPTPALESLLPKRSSSRMFVAGSIDALYLGVVTGQSIDLMVIANGAANCVGTLYVYGEVGQWMVAQDGKTLLAIGDTGGAGWSIAETMQSKASKLRGEGKLRERACAAGLKDITESLSQAEWTAATHLLTPPEGLCEMPPPPKVQSNPATAGTTPTAR